MIDCHILTSHIPFRQWSQRHCERLAVHRVIAVRSSTIPAGSKRLLDGTMVILHVHLHHLEDSLSLFRFRSLIHAGRHGRSTTDISHAVTGYIRDTIDGTVSLAARAELFDLCHNEWSLKSLIV